MLVVRILKNPGKEILLGENSNLGKLQKNVKSSTLNFRYPKVIDD